MPLSRACISLNSVSRPHTCCKDGHQSPAGTEAAAFGKGRLELPLPERRLWREPPSGRRAGLATWDAPVWAFAPGSSSSAFQKRLCTWGALPSGGGCGEELSLSLEGALVSVAGRSAHGRGSFLDQNDGRGFSRGLFFFKIGSLHSLPPHESMPWAGSVELPVAHCAAFAPVVSSSFSFLPLSLFSRACPAPFNHHKSVFAHLRD